MWHRISLLERTRDWKVPARKFPWGSRDSSQSWNSVLPDHPVRSSLERGHSAPRRLHRKPRPARLVPHRPQPRHSRHPDRFRRSSRGRHPLRSCLDCEGQVCRDRSEPECPLVELRIGQERSAGIDLDIKIGASVGAVASKEFSQTQRAD
jgi:hypothetical protein